VGKRSPEVVRPYVSADPNDHAIVQTALTGKEDCVVTADKALLRPRPADLAR
jgi:predicted nucleic acid-binding protein